MVMDDEPVETLLEYGLSEKGIDYAFVPFFWLTNQAYFPYTLEGTNAVYLVPVHINSEVKLLGSIFETMELNFDNAILFRQDYSWYPFE